MTNKTPEQIAAEQAQAAALAAETKKAEKAAAKAAADAAKAEAKAKAEAEKAAKKAAKDAEAKAKADAKAAKDAEKAAAKATKEAEKATPKQVKQNGIALPKEGTIGHTLFTIFNDKSTELKQPCDVTSVIPLAEAKGICIASIRAGYAKWKRFHGLTGRIAAPAAPVAETAPAA